MLEKFGFLFGIALLLALVAFAPFVTIWSLNTLFVSLAIPYTFWTWLATFLLGGTFFGIKSA
jgi:hypothetical protein